MATNWRFVAGLSTAVALPLHLSKR
jgi:hypothetical protein